MADKRKEIVGGLGKAARRLFADRPESVAGVHYADPLAPSTMRMSEALGNVGAEGKTLNFTEADRSRVFGTNRGGVGFSALQHYSEPHWNANTVWGFGNDIVAKKKIKQNDPDKSLWTTFVGAPTQHKSNTVVIKDAVEEFQRAAKQGKVHPAQIKLINDRIKLATDDQSGAFLFDPSYDLTDPKALSGANTFARRSAIGDALLGEGVKGPMRRTAFKEANEGLIWHDAGKMEGILRRETDPDLVGAGTYDVGNRLFVMDGKIIKRPSLNEAFPIQVTGEDLGMKYELVPPDKAMRDFYRAREGRLNKRLKPAPVSYYDLARAEPSQLVDEDYLTFLQKEGYKGGGAVDIEAADARLEAAIANRMAKGGKVDIEAADARLEQAIAQRMAENVPRETSEGVQHMGGGGKADAAKGLKNVFTRVFQEAPPLTPKVRPPSDNVANVRQANFSYPKVIGNQTVKIDKLSGGVRMSDPNEVKRVNALADKIASPEGYISRIIVDHNDNVIEGQHRLEALRQLGIKDVPVYKIEDLGETLPVLKMEEAMRGAGGIHSDHVHQLMQHLLDDIAENGIGGAGKLDYGKWQKHYDAALGAAVPKLPKGQQAVLPDAAANLERLGESDINKAEGGPAFKKLQFMAGGGGAKSKNAPKFSEAFTQGLGPMLYGAARGTAAGLAGIGGDIEELARLGINYAGDKLQGRFPNMLDKRDVVSAKATLPTSEVVLSKIPSLKDFGAGPEARHSEDIAAKLGMYGLSNIAAPKAGKAVVQGVNATGKALAPKAGEMLENYMVRTGGILPMDVWHGSPHRFPPTAKNPLGEFDASKIGTGEGAQAYGYGHYVAEQPLVAKDYKFMERNWFDTDVATYQGKPIQYWYDKAMSDQNLAHRTKNPKLGKDANARLAYWESVMLHEHPESVLTKMTDKDFGWPEATNYAKSVKLDKFQGIAEPGSLYKVDLPDEQIAKMLDWDKPLSQQHPDVQKAISSDPRIARLIASGKIDNMYQSGGEFYRAVNSKYANEAPAHISLDAAENAAQANASQYLKSLGIPGIKYLDQGSRNAGEGTRNFVVFPGNEEMLNILSREKDGGVIHMGGGGRADAAKGLGKGLKRLFADPAESFVASGRKGVEDGRGGNTIIKEGGGNWIGGDVEKGLNRHKGKELSPEDMALARRRLAEHKGNPDYIAGATRRLDEYGRDALLNQFVDKQLTRYVKNQMGTKDDPIRALAEKGPIHTEIAPEFVDITNGLKEKRKGFPVEGLGQSQRAKEWEGASDFAINKKPASYFTNEPQFMVQGAFPKSFNTRKDAQEYIDRLNKSMASHPALVEKLNQFPLNIVERGVVSKNPWLTKVDQDTPIYTGGTMPELGFGHIIDELRNATNPASGLPRELLLKPESLSKLSVPQAVERVAKINEWRAAQMETARKAAREGIPVHKEYPEGYQWTSAPDTAADEKALQYIKDVGCEGGWCTQGESAAKQYGGGNNRLYVLHDPQGKAVTQISVNTTENFHPIGTYGEGNEFPTELHYGEYSNVPKITKEKEKQIYELGKKLYDQKGLGWYNGGGAMDSFQEAANMLIGKLPATSKITEIKGLRNQAPREEHLPYVQDLVRSGNYSDVGDLHYTGLHRKSDFIDQFTSDQLDSIGSGEYVTKQELDSLRLSAKGKAEGGVIHMDKGGTSEEQEAKRYGIPETPEQELQRYLRMFRINASGGKDKYGADIGGRLGINIPLSQNVSIEPYFQGSAYKPNSGKVEHGGIAGANLNIRFNNGGTVSDGAFKTLQWSKPQHFDYGGVASPDENNPTVTPESQRVRDIKKNAKEMFEEAKVEIGNDYQRLKNSPAARAQLAKIIAAGNVGVGPDLLNLINEYVLDPIKSVTVDKVFTKPSSVMLPVKNREDIGYNRDGTRVPKFGSIADVFTTESGVPNPRKDAVVSSYPYDYDEPDIDAKLKRIPLGGSEHVIERMQARNLMYGGKQIITDPHTGNQTEINPGRFHPITEIGGSILTGGGLNTAARLARKGYQRLTDPARIRASALSRAIDKDVETFTKKPLPRKRGGLTQLNTR